MGAITGFLGLGGGANGTGFDKPGLAGIQAGVNSGQADQSYKQNQAALQGQDQLLAALQGQNGIGNQSQVYGQLQGIASGAVNPAQAQFSNNTAQNVANQSALMAGQRGAGANVGLMARQAGQQGAAIQQQAVGQEAAQQAQNQIGAIGQAGQLATTQAGQQIGQVNANVGAQQAEQANLLNALGQLNNANISNQGSVNAANAGLAQTGMKGQQDLVGGLLNTGGGASKMAAGSQGGMLMAGGGMAGPQSSFGQFLVGVSAPGASQMTAPTFAAPDSSNSKLKEGAGKLGGLFSSSAPEASYAGADSGSDFSGYASNGGMIDVVVSPGEKIVPPKEVAKCAQGGKPQMKTVPGKAEVSGDSVKNDNVQTKLPAGTVVVKRTRANNNPEGFIREVLSKRKGGK